MNQPAYIPISVGGVTINAAYQNGVASLTANTPEVIRVRPQIMDLINTLFGVLAGAAAEMTLPKVAPEQEWHWKAPMNMGEVTMRPDVTVLHFHLPEGKWRDHILPLRADG